MSACLESGSTLCRSPWGLLGLVLTVLLGEDRSSARDAIATEACGRLAIQTEIVARNLAEALQAMANGLDAIREDPPELLARPDGRDQLSRR